MNTAKKYVLLVCSAPYTYQGGDTALCFAKALIAKGHIIEQVFFYHDGVYISSDLTEPEQAERKINKDWAELARLHQVDLVVCSHSAMKRGILDQQIAQQTGHDHFNLNSRFKIQGLGQFVDAVCKADRLVSFGVHSG